jgi:hypothetical protein
MLLQVHLHTGEEGPDQLVIYLIPVDGKLKTVQNGIEADALLNGPEGLFFELRQQNGFIMIVKGIYYFIGKANKPIDVADGAPQVGVQQPDSRVKGSAVGFRGDLAATFTNLMK